MGENGAHHPPAIEFQQHQTTIFWDSFRRRTLLITATINDYSVARHCWRDSQNSKHRRYARVLAAVELLHSQAGGGAAIPQQEAEDELADWPTVLRASEAAPLLEAQQAVEPPATESVLQRRRRRLEQAEDWQAEWRTQMDQYGLAYYYETQEDYERSDDITRSAPGHNSAGPTEAALKRDLALKLYQLYGNTKYSFFFCRSQA